MTLEPRLAEGKEATGRIIIRHPSHFACTGRTDEAEYSGPDATRWGRGDRVSLIAFRENNRAEGIIMVIICQSSQGISNDLYDN